MKKYTRKITKVGRLSYSIVIPRELIDELKWRERQRVVLSRRGKNITVKNWKS